MSNSEKMNEILAKVKVSASDAASKAAVAAKASSAGISAGLKEMRENAASESTDGGARISSADGDFEASGEAGIFTPPGEMSISSDEKSGADMDERYEGKKKHSPEEVINACIQNIIDGFKRGLGSRQILSIAGAMALIWFVLTLLPSFGINPLPVQLLSFLSFAQGGLTGGMPGLIGGIIGKGLIAYFVALIITGKLTPEGIISHVKRLTGSFGGKKYDAASLSPLLIGLGVSVFVYNFLAGSSWIFNILVGVVAFIVAARAFANKAGCIRKIFSSVFESRGYPDSGIIAGVMAGWALGFGLGVVLSFTGGILGGSICYIAGIIILIAGIALFYTANTRGGALA